MPGSVRAVVSRICGPVSRERVVGHPQGRAAGSRDRPHSGRWAEALEPSGSETVFENSTCTYSWIRSTWSAGSNKEFSVSVFPAGDLEVMAGAGERTPIDGVGDEAFETSDNYYARVGDAVAHVVNLQETPEASIAVLTAAAGGL